jgi:hypothetical protein
MLDVIRRYGLDRWGPLSCVVFALVIIVALVVAALVILTRPSVAEVIRAGQALATGAVAIGAVVIGHGHLQGQREVADATREAAAIAATAPPSSPAAIAAAVSAADTAHVRAAVAPPDEEAGAGKFLRDEEELAHVPRPSSAVTPDPVPGHHGPDTLEEASS